MLKKTCTTELHASSGLLFKTICQAAPKEVSQNRNLWPKKLPLSPPLVLENELLQDTGSTQKFFKNLKTPQLSGRHRHFAPLLVIQLHPLVAGSWN